MRRQPSWPVRLLMTVMMLGLAGLGAWFTMRVHPKQSELACGRGLECWVEDGRQCIRLPGREGNGSATICTYVVGGGGSGR